MQVYDLLISEEYMSNGQKKTAFHKVGAAFDAKNGSGFNCETLPGVSLTGRFMVRPRKERAAAAPAPAEAADARMMEPVEF